MARSRRDLVSLGEISSISARSRRSRRDLADLGEISVKILHGQLCQTQSEVANWKCEVSICLNCYLQYSNVILQLSHEKKTYGDPQVHTKFKSLTPNLNHSHRIQITHTEFKSLTPNSKHSHLIQIQVTQIKFKIVTLKSNHSHGNQITHTKFLNSINQFRMYWIHRFCMSYINVVQQTSLPESFVRDRIQLNEYTWPKVG